MSAVEANFDGLVGPTHHYGGLSYGNVASTANAGDVSNPRAAALQGLAKMKALSDLGLLQGVLPPHERPHVPTLRSLGFRGSDEQVLATVAEADPGLLEAVSSASAMWVANAATVSPAADTADGRTHFTVANMTSNLHRSMEADTTHRILQRTFSDEARFAVHRALPEALGDEGAANHIRLTPDHGATGIEVFVYGGPGAQGPSRFPARQHRRASEAVARRHGLDPDRTMFVQQNPMAIDAGAFHNDVVSVGNLDVFLRHEEAFLDSSELDRRLLRQIPTLQIIEVQAHRIPLEKAVSTYLFNSQLVRIGNENVLIAPQEVRNDPEVWEFVQELIEDPGGIDDIQTFDLRQSMRNGGGPACLRLRVVLSNPDAVNPRSVLDDDLHDELVGWVMRHYREELTASDLADPLLLDETRVALDELSRLLDLGPVYDFQR